MQKKTCRRIRRLILFVSFCAVLLLILSVSPLGITRLQLQNRIFTIESIDIIPQEDIFYVTLDISARSWYPWSIEVNHVCFMSMGENNLLLDNLKIDSLPIDLSFSKEQILTASFTFDFDLFQQNTMLPENVYSYEESAQAFLQSIGLIFESDDLPKGEALCMNWNY